ncbi:MAG: hypothetical protein AAB444_00670 [Patescibacteria group bacterium]
MTDDRWREVVDKVKAQFQVRDEGRREIEDIPRAFAEYIIFETPQGEIKLERVTSPVVLDKKTIYSKLAGSASRVEYTYSDTEMFSKLRVFKWVESRDEWEEMRGGQSFSL